MLIFNYLNFIKKIYESIDDGLLNKIDYTLLKPESTENEIIELCEKAKILGVKSVCVLPKMVSLAKKNLENSDVLVCTVISFPHGDNNLQSKIAETKQVISNGADEVDMVITYKKLKKKSYKMSTYTDDYSYQELIEEVRSLANICHANDNKNGESIILKVIVESGLLTEEETEIVTNICLEADADFIKTSTGMVPNKGAELSKVIIMRDIIEKSGKHMKIKASGGIRTLEDLQKFEPYVDRFGVGCTAVDSIFGNKENNDNSY